MTNSNLGFALVTPASRGLGFSLARWLLSKTNIPVVATARKGCDEVRQRLMDGLDASKNVQKRLEVFPVDVTGKSKLLRSIDRILIVPDESSIESMTAELRKLLAKTSLRLALTVPGVLHVEKSPGQINASNAWHSFQVNTLGQLLLMKHLSPFLPTKSQAGFAVTESLSGGASIKLPSHAIYAMMAARVGSISDNRTGGWYSYRASKAAVFQLAKTFDLHLRTRSQERAIAIALHPGTVRTDFTQEYWGGRDMLEPDEAAERLIRVITEMSPGPGDGRGRCWDWKGNEVLP
ncbi:uncharacterized protein ACLA_077470 [Aspergillus clavatus NRRL 1]|uniref:Short-chain dehydrogenase/reductase n=1 Tax=Aspergillus clavatus (strain ATCC 1007 / CBS 513.65 / DSM 816 / NCTC 3887 / NRRL 1 / QM 1276 / 107) TaxID=344612 RepID=A1CLM1_ASPCL|nr:uncharacterized protein ACLA_077470 [Aspergillus clavatus NRRL 1]EAW09000.1 conserved hypothetical protein [Aspergillus clavatus NRRL 1]